jgi:hypothetical protein
MAPPTSSKRGRRRNPGLSSAPQQYECRPLSPEAVRRERLALAHDLIQLVSQDEALPPLIQDRVHVLCGELHALWRETHGLP